uniref:Uncharacterized protein n=1 Tax=Triticum urartu TaxID=4572 RepID=A0A8R7K398_TRIUA
SRHNAPSAWSTSTGCYSSSRCMTRQRKRHYGLGITCWLPTTENMRHGLTWKQEKEETKISIID